MKNDRKHSQASTRRRIAGAAATLSVLAGVLGLGTGALASSSSPAVQLTSTTAPPVATPTFLTSAPSTTTAKVTWTNVSPIKLGRDGTDSTGAGPWNTGMNGGVPAAALTAQSFTFANLIPGATYNYTLTNADGTTLTVRLTQPGVTAPVTTTLTPSVTSTAGAVVPRTPGSLNAPTKVIFDEEFAGNSLNRSLWSPSWFGDGSTQNGTVMASSNVSVDANGLELKLNANRTGGIVSSDPTDGQSGHTGFQVAPSAGRPVYVEYTATLPASGSQIANWPALWLTGQAWPMNGEIDVMEGFGSSQFHIEYGPNAGSVSNPGGVGGSTADTHTYGVLWSTTGTTFVYDGVVVGLLPHVNTSGKLVGPETASLSGTMYLVMENSLGSPTVLNATMTVRDLRVWE